MTNEEAIKEIRSCLGVNNIIMPYSDEMIAFGMAIEALEKQIPKKPIHGQNCSMCDTFNFRHRNYCFNCGQAIDWSEEE